MKKDIWADLANTAESAFLQENELEGVCGGFSLGELIIHLPVNLKCSSNNCDPVNVGACAGNTMKGAPGTCPLSD